MRKTKSAKQKFPHKQQIEEYCEPRLEVIDNLIPILENAEKAYHAVRLTENEIADLSLALIALLQNEASQITINEQIKSIIRAKEKLAVQNELLENRTSDLNERSLEINIHPLDLRGYRNRISGEQDTKPKKLPYENESKSDSSNLSKASAETNIGISSCFTELNFWETFIKDLKTAKESILLVSPFIFRARTTRLISTFKTLIDRGVRIHLVTKPAHEYMTSYEEDTKELLSTLKNTGLRILVYGDCHQKIAIIDETIVWEGSLNILSHRPDENSTTKEHMRRLVGYEIAKDVYKNLRIKENTSPVESSSDKKAC